MNNGVIVITGASEGIGAALAKLAGGQGNKVVLAARTEAKLRTVASEVGDNALVVVTDVTRRADVERLKVMALERFGHVDVWVNNAGRGISKPVLELTDDEVDQMVAINLKSDLYGMQAIIPHFVERGAGHLINVSTVLSKVPFVPLRAAYSAAKAGLNILTANLRMSLAAYPQIHVSLVLPGVVRTQFFENALGGTPNWQGTTAQGAQTAEEVAAVIAEVMDNPRPEVYTNPASPEMVRRYSEDIAGFEASLARR
ncbi:MAG TPA: SDR family NAD(P)-dependent oxidoreductase [bacterium]|jgi:short-subunit dehydrogenase